MNSVTPCRRRCRRRRRRPSCLSLHLPSTLHACAATHLYAYIILRPSSMSHQMRQSPPAQAHTQSIAVQHTTASSLPIANAARARAATGRCSCSARAQSRCANRLEPKCHHDRIRIQCGNVQGSRAMAAHSVVFSLSRTGRRFIWVSCRRCATWTCRC